MIACVDVNYRVRAIAGCILIKDWLAEPPYEKLIHRGTTPAAYQSGEFFRRELSPLLETLKKIPSPIECVIVDGYVWLTEDKSPGLGGYLYRELGETVPVIGVAKNRYRDEEFFGLVFRGGSRRPLYVTAAGMDQIDTIFDCPIYTDYWPITLSPGYRQRFRSKLWSNS